MKINGKLLATILLSVTTTIALAVAGVTTVTRYRITNSTVDSTPVGSATPASGAFTSITASQGLTANSITSIYGDIVAFGPGFLRSGPQGGVTAGSGGFYTTGASNLGATTATQFNGPLNGNATTATALSTGGASCPYQGGSSGYYSPLVSVNARGGGICGPLHQWVQTNTTCTASGGSYSTCQVILNWPTSFPNSGYTPVCQGGGPGGPGNQPGAGTVQIANFNNSSITVNIANQASNSGVTFAALYCQANE